MIPETRNDDNIDLVSQQKVIEMKLEYIRPIDTFIIFFSIFE